MEEYKIRLMFYKEWQQNASFIDAFKRVNSKLGHYSIRPDEVRQLFERFDNDNTEIFDTPENAINYFNKKTALRFFSEQHGTTSKNLLNSILCIDHEKVGEYYSKNVTTKNGRFILFFYSNQTRVSGNGSFIEIYDLFNGTKRSNAMDFKVLEMKHALVGDGYLLSVGTKQNPHVGADQEYRVLKIDFEALTVNQLETDDSGFWDRSSIRVDQFDSSKFIIFGNSTYKAGKIQQDGEITWGNAENFGELIEYGMRLINDKLQGFQINYSLNPFSSSLKFVSFNLETMKKTATNMNVNEDYDFPSNLVWGKNGNWVGNKFYQLLSNNRDNTKECLFTFDLDTLQWSSVKIFAYNYSDDGSMPLCFPPIDFFVDDNEAATMLIKNEIGHCTFYRISLRKPDTLMNLSRFVALREANVYSNEKYLTIGKKIGAI